MIGLGVTLERPRTAARAVLTEARPGTAVVLLPEWAEAWGIRYDPMLPVAETQARLAAMETALGDVTLNELQAQLDQELPGLVVSEPSASSEAGVEEAGVGICAADATEVSTVYYDVNGSLITEEQELRLLAVLQHFAPLHLVPHVLLTIEGLSSTSEAGEAVCGMDECGSDGT